MVRRSIEGFKNFPDHTLSSLDIGLRFGHELTWSFCMLYQVMFYVVFYRFCFSFSFFFFFQWHGSSKNPTDCICALTAFEYRDAPQISSVNYVDLRGKRGWVEVRPVHENYGQFVGNSERASSSAS